MVSRLSRHEAEQFTHVNRSDATAVALAARAYTAWVAGRMNETILNLSTSQNAEEVFYKGAAYLHGAAVRQSCALNPSLVDAALLDTAISKLYNKLGLGALPSGYSDPTNTSLLTTSVKKGMVYLGLCLSDSLDIRSLALAQMTQTDWDFLLSNRNATGELLELGHNTTFAQEDALYNMTIRLDKLDMALMTKAVYHTLNTVRVYSEYMASACSSLDGVLSEVTTLDDYGLIAIGPSSATTYNRNYTIPD